MAPHSHEKLSSVWKMTIERPQPTSPASIKGGKGICYVLGSINFGH